MQMADYLRAQETLQASVCRVLEPNRGEEVARTGQVIQNSWALEMVFESVYSLKHTLGSDNLGRVQACYFSAVQLSQETLGEYLRKPHHKGSFMCFWRIWIFHLPLAVLSSRDEWKLSLVSVLREAQDHALASCSCLSQRHGAFSSAKQFAYMSYSRGTDQTFLKLGPKNNIIPE